MPSSDPLPAGNFLSFLSISSPSFILMKLYALYLPYQVLAPYELSALHPREQMQPRPNDTNVGLQTASWSNLVGLGGHSIPLWTSTYKTRSSQIKEGFPSALPRKALYVENIMGGCVLCIHSIYSIQFPFSMQTHGFPVVFSFGKFMRDLGVG